MDNWISVEDGLPENGDDVLVYTSDEYVSLGEYSNRKWRVYGTPYFDPIAHVTHWMPLPKPPQK